MKFQKAILFLGLILAFTMNTAFATDRGCDSARNAGYEDGYDGEVPSYGSTDRDCYDYGYDQGKWQRFTDARAGGHSSWMVNSAYNNGKKDGYANNTPSFGSSNLDVYELGYRDGSRQRMIDARNGTHSDWGANSAYRAGYRDGCAGQFPSYGTQNHDCYSLGHSDGEFARVRGKCKTN